MFRTPLLCAASASGSVPLPLLQNVSAARPLMGGATTRFLVDSAAGRHASHSEVNTCIKRALAEAGDAATLEPVGRDVGGSKRPDGLQRFASLAEQRWRRTRQYHIARTSAESRRPLSLKPKRLRKEKSLSMHL